MQAFFRFFLEKNGVESFRVIQELKIPETHETSEVLVIFPEKMKIPIFEAVKILLEIH